jgi:hypothetical protein
LLLSLQINWEEFGVDFSSPVSLENEGTVIIEQSADVLSDEEKHVLQQQLHDIDTVLTEENLLENFIIAKLFVHTV